MTNSFLVKELDITSMKLEDLSFHAPFHLHIRRNGNVHAFVTYFNIEFSACHTRVGFSTCKHFKEFLYYFCFLNERFLIKKRTILYILTGNRLFFTSKTLLQPKLARKYLALLSAS